MTRTTPSLKKLLTGAALMMTLGLHAQEDITIPAEDATLLIKAPAPAWGFRIDLALNETAPEVTLPVMGTWRKNRHQLGAGLVFNPFDTKMKSMLFGGCVTYQYSPFSFRGRFHPYVYVNLVSGQYRINEEVRFFYPDDETFVRGISRQRSFNSTVVAGIGTEIRFGIHSYVHASVAAGAGYEKLEVAGEFTEQSDKEPPGFSTNTSTVLAAEAKIGFGYRF